jgi:hypothetical protein
MRISAYLIFPSYRSRLASRILLVALTMSPDLSYTLLAIPPNPRAERQYLLLQFLVSASAIRTVTGRCRESSGATI